MPAFQELSDYCTHAREPFFKVAAKYAVAGRPTLDLGPGSTGFADMVGDKDIYLVEGNPQNAERLREKYKNTLHLRLPGKLPFEDDFFSLIHSSHLVEHLQPQELYDLLTECDRCLAQDGHLVISAPLLWEGFYYDLSHVKPYGPQVISKYLMSSDHIYTRPPISDQYTVSELIYRYRKVPLPPMAFTYKPQINRLVHKLLTFLQKHNLHQYEKTGYTLVLKKGQPAGG